MKNQYLIYLVDNIDPLAGQPEIQIGNLPQCKAHHESGYHRSDADGGKNVCIPQTAHRQSDDDHCGVKNNFNC